MNHITIKAESGEDIAGIDWNTELDWVSLSGRSGQPGVLRVIRGHFRIKSSYVLTEPSLVGRVES